MNIPNKIIKEFFERTFDGPSPLYEYELWESETGDIKYVFRLSDEDKEKYPILNPFSILRVWSNDDITDANISYEVE